MSWLPKQTVVVPVDFSESSADAVSNARQMVAHPGDLRVVHALLPLDYASPGVLFDQVTEESRKAATEKHAHEFMEKHGHADVPIVVRVGDPGSVITDYATELHADLIVIPSHGYHGIRRFVLGSVAERVIRHADCAVLVLRRRDAR